MESGNFKRSLKQLISLSSIATTMLLSLPAFAFAPIQPRAASLSRSEIMIACGCGNRSSSGGSTSSNTSGGSRSSDGGWRNSVRSDLARQSAAKHRATAPADPATGEKSEREHHHVGIPVAPLEAVQSPAAPAAVNQNAITPEDFSPSSQGANPTPQSIPSNTSPATTSSDHNLNGQAVRALW
jgi:hypothetical protein